MAVPALRPGLEVPEIAAFLERHGVPAGGRLLDAPCGIGRRALGLAEHGYRVTGLDANEIGIEAARTRVPPPVRERLRYEARPREAWPGEPGPFDAVLCLDHALGRGTAAEDVGLLARVRAAVAPGGFLAVEMLHRDFFALRPKPFAFHVVGAMEQHEFRTLDPITGVLDLTWKFYERVGEDLKHRADSAVSLRLLAPHEVRGLCEGAGWRVESVAGGWRDEPLKPERRTWVLSARVK